MEKKMLLKDRLLNAWGALIHIEIFKIIQSSNAINNLFHPTINGALKSALVVMTLATWLIAMATVCCQD
jgi:hypothetical protein